MPKKLTLQEKVSELVGIRERIEDLKRPIAELQGFRDQLQAEIIAEMTKIGFNSVKTDKVVVSKQVRTGIYINDESALIKDLKARKIPDMVVEAVNRTLWPGFSKQAIKENISLAGTELKETEFISIRKTKTKGGE